MRFNPHLVRTMGLIGLFAAGRAFGDVPLSIADAVAKIRDAENRLGIVEVNGFKGQSFSRRADGRLTPTPKRIEGSVLFDGVIGGSFLFNSVTETFPMGSPSSTRYASATWTRSFDGKQGRVLHRPKKFANGREHGGEAEIIAGPSGIQSEAYASLCDGAAASLGYFQPFLKVEGSKSPRLGDSLAAMLDQKVALTIEREKIDNIQAIKISDPFGNAYWFDPARGFALIRASTTPAAGIADAPFRELFVDALVQIDDNTWYPVKGRWEDAVRTPGSADQLTFSVQSAVRVPKAKANFVAEIPPHYTVHDLIANKVYTSASPTTLPVPQH